jgi:hypothetical protein
MLSPTIRCGFDPIPVRRSEHFRNFLNERGLLEKHAREHGCSLLLSPFVDFSLLLEHRSQLEVLKAVSSFMPRRRFLWHSWRVGSRQPDSCWRLVRCHGPPSQPGFEYRQTIFSHHADGTSLDAASIRRSKLVTEGGSDV